MRNPNYREPGKPYLDAVIDKFTPDKAASVQALEAGDIDAAWFLDPTFLSQLATLSDISVDPAPGPQAGVWQVFVNTSCANGPQQGDPGLPARSCLAICGSDKLSTWRSTNRGSCTV